MDATAFRQEIEATINRNCMENGSNTPDFILAKYLTTCLESFDLAVKEREAWYGRGAQQILGGRRFADGQRVIVIVGHYKLGSHGTVKSLVGKQYRLILDDEPKPVYLFEENQLVEETSDNTQPPSSNPLHNIGQGRGDDHHDD